MGLYRRTDGFRDKTMRFCPLTVPKKCAARMRLIAGGAVKTKTRAVYP